MANVNDIARDTSAYQAGIAAANAAAMNLIVGSRSGRQLSDKLTEAGGWSRFLTAAFVAACGNATVQNGDRTAPYPVRYAFQLDRIAEIRDAAVEAAEGYFADLRAERAA